MELPLDVQRQLQEVNDARECFIALKESGLIKDNARGGFDMPKTAVEFQQYQTQHQLAKDMEMVKAYGSKKRDEMLMAS